MKAWWSSLGSLGSAFTALCCMGAPALLAFLSAVGLGFIIHDAILIPLLILFLAISLWATHASSRLHGRKSAFYLTMVSVVLVFVGIWFSGVVVGIGIAGLFLASGTDLYYSKRYKMHCGTA